MRYSEDELLKAIQEIAQNTKKIADDIQRIAKDIHSIEEYFNTRIYMYEHGERPQI